MTSTSTLTSLAILKVNLDRGNDYLDYLRPFILQVLIDSAPNPITGRAVSDLVRVKFGLQVPERASAIVLNRISRRHAIKKIHGIYRIVGELPNPHLDAKTNEVECHISSVVWGLRKFSKDTIKPLLSEEDAVNSICHFLEKFDVICLRSFVQGTAIPQLERTQNTDIVLVSEYVQYVRRTDPERFKSFLILVQGHMLANALLCPDLDQAPNTYQNVTFYFDTPLLVGRLGAEGKSKQSATRELILLLIRLGGKVAVFSHSRDELYHVLRGASTHVERPDGRGAIVLEARRNGTTPSDLMLLAESIDEKLTEAGIEIKPTPSYVERFQIDESVFEKILDDEVAYYNPKAKTCDINSVRSIYAIRGRRYPRSIEKSKAVFVTSNTAFAKAAWEYGKEVESSRNVSSVITDFSLANVAWLKAPMGAQSIPVTQLLAFSYAAVEPSRELLGKFMHEIDKLEQQGGITALHHQLLRSNPLTPYELMSLTLGEESALTVEMITETLKRVSGEIVRQETEKLTAEMEAHRKTREELESSQSEKEEIQHNIYWRCRNRARNMARAFSASLGVLLSLGTIYGFGVRSEFPIIVSILIGGSVALGLMTLMNLAFGSTIQKVQMGLEHRLLNYLVKREAKAIGFDLSEFVLDSSETEQSVVG